MGRVKFTAKNIAFGYIGNLMTAVMSFVLRTIFIMYLDRELLGVNSLYTNILSLLSMAELGIGTALNYSLYAPVAKHDTEKIKSYMQMYRKAYTVIAFVVAGIGLAIAPFLKYIIKDPGSITIRDLTLYYFIFLFNTVSTYFVSYKYSLVNAEQKNYIQTNIITITKIITVALQILILITTKNFYCFLLTDAIIQLIQKIFVSKYLDKLYPYLKERNVLALTAEETGEIWRKTKALVLHKVGDVARLQTDSIIISAFIGVALNGVVENYNLVINTLANFVNVIFNSVISSFGNLIATESEDKQYAMFKIYRFFAVWVYGFVTTGFLILLTPFIRDIWNLGEQWVLPAAVVYCILIDFYCKGDRIVLSNYKTAAGVFEQDKYLALIQGAVNLVISIVLVVKIGLVGIYIGTIVSGLIANVTKPIIIYRVCFHRSAASYFTDTIKYVLVLVSIIAGCMVASHYLMSTVNFASFFLMVIVITIVFHAVFLGVFGRTDECKYLVGIVKSKLRK